MKEINNSQIKMLTYIRHSRDKVDPSGHLDDPKLTTEGKMMAINKGIKLIQRYGVPDIIYCSPFLRTRQTLHYLLESLPENKVKTIKIIYDYRAARSSLPGADLASSTRKAIPKQTGDLTKRLNSLTSELDQLNKKGKKVWCVTHTSVFKRLVDIHGIVIPSMIPYLYSCHLYK